MSRDKCGPAPVGDDRASLGSDDSLLDLLLPPPPPPPPPSDTVRPYFDDPRLARLVHRLSAPFHDQLPTYRANLAMAAPVPHLLAASSAGGGDAKPGLCPDDGGSRHGSQRATRRASSVQQLVDKVRADLDRRRSHYQLLDHDEDPAAAPLVAPLSLSDGDSDLDPELEEAVAAAAAAAAPADQQGPDGFQLRMLHGQRRRSARTQRSTLVPQVIAALAVSVGSMLVGFTSAYTSPALASMRQPDSTLKITDTQESWIGSLMPLSALCGGLFSGSLIERLGRKITIMGTGLPFMLSYALIAFAQDVYTVYVARVIAGLCIGVLSLAMPVYLGETIQSDIRGTLGLLPTTIGNTGILVCFLAGTYLRWDHLAMFAGCIPVPFLILMWFVPETPRWYISHGNMRGAAKSLRWLRGRDVNISDELSAIAVHIATSQRAHSSFRDLLSPHYFRALAISLALMLFQQTSGINAVIFYTVRIFKTAGSSIDGNLATVVVGLVNFGATFIANVMIDRLGRKILLYISSSMMVVSLLVLGSFFYMKEQMPERRALVIELGWLPLVSFMVFVVAFSVGWGPIPWLFLGEGLPGRIRGSAGSIATAFNWACTFVVTKTFNDLNGLIGAHGTFWLFGACTAAGLLFTVGCMPETKGKSLEEIEKTLFTVRQGSLKKRAPSPEGV